MTGNYESRLYLNTKTALTRRAMHTIHPHIPDLVGEGTGACTG
jgi:hypothetical protein